MGYEHLSITPETESDEVAESNVENLLPIPSKYEVTLEDEIKCDMPAEDDCSPVFTTFSNPLFKDNDNFDSSDDESLPDEDVPAEEFKIYSNSFFDEDEINYDKLDPHCFNDGNSQHDEIDIVTETNDVLPPSDENDDDLSNDSLLEEDNSIPSGIKNVDPEGDIHFLKELLINDSILSDELSDANFEENPSIPRPPPKPPDVETNAGEEIPVMMNNKDEDVDYSYLIFVIYPEMFPFLLSAESEDTIFGPVCESPIEIVIFQLLSLRTNEFRDRVELTTRLLKSRGFPSQNKTPGSWSARIPMWQLFKRLWKLLKDLKELVEYDQSTNTDRPIFLNDNHPENSSEENVVSKTNQEPPQDSDIHQLIEECSVEVLEEQK
nr:hypothetical protein [Tanacetum cinerariifolium]